MTIEQANEYFSSLPEGFAPAEELRAALTADVQKVQFVGVAGTAGKTAAAGLLAAILREAAFHVGFYRAGCEPLSARIAIGGVSVDPVLLCQAAEALNAAKPLPREAAELAASARCFGAAGCKLAVVELPDAGLASALPNMPVCAVTAIGPDGVSRSVERLAALAEKFRVVAEKRGRVEAVASAAGGIVGPHEARPVRTGQALGLLIHQQEVLILGVIAVSVPGLARALAQSAKAFLAAPRHLVQQEGARTAVQRVHAVPASPG